MVNELTSNADLSGSTKVTTAEAREHEAALFAKRFTEIPSNMQMRVDYNLSDNSEKTIGFAARNVSTADGGWLLQRFHYSLASFPGKISARLIAYDSWDNRDTATYG